MATDFKKEFLILKQKVLEKNEDTDIDLIKKAYDFAELKHRGQKRNSGEDYFIHPIAVAKTLCDMNLDDQTICAGLMHDVLEDTDCSYEYMKELFGQEITFLVDGVTKLKRIKFKSKEEKQAENIRKMVMAMSNDVRVILIKLADRLHNMRTLEYKTSVKQRKTATETIEIYVPIAHRLGIYTLKWELEDLCLRYLEPEIYYELAEMVNKKRKEREEYIERIIKKLKPRLDEQLKNYSISGRPKSLYSIYKKMYKQNIEFDKIYDLTAVRVIVDTLSDCYNALGVVHNTWKPIGGRIKDYIANPKPNGYKSLHTTVFGDSGNAFEVQIRTKKMHEEAEYGIAAHWKYKEGKKNSNKFDDTLTFIRQIMEWQKEGGDHVNNREFMETLKGDFFSDEIYVYSPNGDIINLPVDSCAIDFAYRIHTDVGNTCIGCKISGRIMPLSHKLKTGDVVEILTSKNSSGPSRDWLSIVKSNQARNKIRQYFKKHEKSQNIELGKEILIKEIRKIRPDYKELMKLEWLKEASERLSFSSIDDMYASVGFGSTPTTQIIPKLKAKYEKEYEKDFKQIDIPSQNVKKGPKDGVRVRDFDEDIEVKFAKCCNPVPGDNIVGFITKGRGISVHLRNCPNIVNLNSPDRLIDVYWENDNSDRFPVRIELLTTEAQGIFVEVTKIINNEGINISGINAKSNDDQTAIIDLTLDVKNAEQLTDVVNKLKEQKFILDVYRKKG
ncbi:MAG: bifunctional (p)ppGpp synthetase/guanosine-3',5'-bis(diphosphate) 3'-pyrophosphohydrolase [Tissierellia bacterium]|nr:bifunctional (p)ppGpp synthetase/guanosine-3',5'-bis(diphosphate) 3'-pyrophosphohydrolase [Tissierellia bacterium]